MQTIRFSQNLLPKTSAAALLVLSFALFAAPERAQAQSSFNALQQEALKRGCKKFYDEIKVRDEYTNCTQGRSGRTKDSLIDGCFALYRDNSKDLRSCLGKYANTIRDLQ